jgi:hypothetical protein
MDWTLRSIGMLGFAAGVALAPVGASADSTDQPFLVTTSATTPGGTVSFRDVMIVRGNDTGVSSDLAAAVRDRSCYLMFQHVLTNASDRKPTTLSVALDDAHVVPIAVKESIAEPAVGARLVEAIGDGGGDLVSATADVPIDVHVDLRVLTQDGELQAATYREATSVASPGQAVAVSSCSVQRLPQVPSDPNAASPSQPVTPVQVAPA